MNAMLRMAILIVLPVLLSACGHSQMFGRSSDSDGYWLPLSVALRLDSTVTEAAVPYTDACRQPQTLPIGDRLRDALKREIGSVFERVTIASVQDTSSPRPFDGVVDVNLGLQETDLFIPRQATKSYPVTVRLGASLVYTDSKGVALYTKHLRTEAHGTVDTEAQQCDVHGLPAIAHQAATTLAQGLKKHLGTSTKVREAALATAERRHLAASPGSGSSATPEAPAATRQKPDVETALTFRVMLKDENQDGVVQGGEVIVLEIEVMNSGADAINDVMLSLDGTAALVEQFAKADSIGTVQPGETKRLTLQGTAPNLERLTEAELIVSIEHRAFARQANQKKFQVALEPKPPAMETADDVDRIPERVPGYLRQKAVGIAVGIGTFRNRDVPGVQFAARDAEVMAEYFRTVSGIPAARVRLATDDHALKDDLIELFEGWLPAQTVQNDMVFIFFAGRGIINPVTGAVSLIPYEADPASATRLYSLRRLYEALARLPIQRAVLLMDLTFEAPPPSDGMS
ncbi:MAG TPA: hypothetical protein VJ692_01405, partial [Nitrospiraceae bacterium]|nr:hypothetical protein [Nitrospiraceae bacterium]